MDVPTDQCFPGRPGRLVLERFLPNNESMGLFPDLVTPAPYRVAARRELHRVCLELEYECRHADELRRVAAGHPELALKVSAAEVRIAALRARAAQLRRSAGRLVRAA
jgi:hypothetical protein